VVGARVSDGESGALRVDGLSAPAIGQVAFDLGIVVHELVALEASLEEAFMAMTADSVQFHGHLSADPGATASNVSAAVGAGSEK
jgi:ABC-2 type transport system ATP-binding protein